MWAEEKKHTECLNSEKSGWAWYICSVLTQHALPVTPVCPSAPSYHLNGFMASGTLGHTHVHQSR